MKSAEEWKAERWEGEDYIITGFGFKHPSVFTRREAVMLVEVLKSATPTIQRDAWEQGMTDAAKICLNRITGKWPDTDQEDKQCEEEIILNRDFKSTP